MAKQLKPKPKPAKQPSNQLAANTAATTSQGGKGSKGNKGNNAPTPEPNPTLQDSPKKKKRLRKQAHGPKQKRR